MKTGRTLTELAAEITRQSKVKADYVAPTNELTFLTTESGSELFLPNGKGEFGIKPLAHQQLASHLGIPSQYYQRLQGSGYTSLLDLNVNHLFRIKPENRMVRTIDGQVRAFLSDRYRRLDNDQLAEHMLPILGQIPDVHFPSVEITENRLYLKAVAPRIQGEVKTGDVVQAGVVITNSEVGQGSLSISPMFFRLVCLNGAIVETAVRRYHVGRHVESDDNYEVYTDATLRADDKAFWMKTADVLRQAVSETNFNRLLVKMRAAAESQPMVNPLQGVRELTNRFALADHEQESILAHLVSGGDLTRWGALNAVTRASQDLDDYDRATDLEFLGGAILNMGEKEWTTVASATAPATPARRKHTVAVTADALVEAIGR